MPEFSSSLTTTQMRRRKLLVSLWGRRLSQTRVEAPIVYYCYGSLGVELEILSLKVG